MGAADRPKRQPKQTIMKDDVLLIASRPERSGGVHKGVFIHVGFWAHNRQTQIFNYGSDYNKYVYECQRHLDEFPSLRLGVRGL